MAGTKTPKGSKGIKAVQEFWTALMSDPAAEMKDRLKASENLAKSLEMFSPKGEDAPPESDVSVTVHYKEDAS